MKWEDMKKDYDQSSNYVKLTDGEVIEGSFDGEFSKKVKDFNGKLTTRYEIAFITGGQRKIFSGSFKFFQQCNEAAELSGMSFHNALFKIKRNGTGLDTRYTMAVVGGQNKNPVTKAKEEAQSDIPF